MGLPRSCLSERLQSLLVCLLFMSVCYLLLLYPAYQRQEDIWSYYSMSPDCIMWLHNKSQRIVSSPCKSNFSRSKLSDLYPGKPLGSIPVFVGQGSGPPLGSRTYEPPFGFRGCEEQLRKTTGMLPQVSGGIPEELVPSGCKRCIVVGNGGILGGSKLGPYIDQHSIVIRLNNGPVSDHAGDVGTKTTLRIAYPEGALKLPQEYDPASLLVVATFKCTDLTWLSAMVRKEPLNLWQKLWFWQSVPELVPLEPHNFRILNLDVIRETAMNYLGFPEPTYSWWRWKQVIPTLGVTSVITALHLCDEVNLAGFGYDMHHPDLPLHYYEAIRMDAMNAQAVHNVNQEKIFLASLVKGKVVNDLTGGINW
ncbi:ST3 beta-galactoside alpha-2,3-sialyltransferase 7 [Pristis pectinata]|uniref:ST3 beta-galactoside alpha-2,3-sialyltransferase 7 n=1 Tax=Pristis pectinata TaxID=685728 RepID=UPI00223C8F5F|nr:ST3 beta-galactoside alpha-2,3-sialyltransferase 7 [Pristis pectinata]